jgi:glycosyltransferase involved in cell wall biosynthesis
MSFSKRSWVLFLPKWYPEAGSHNGNFIRNHAQAVAPFYTVAVLYVAVKNQQELFTTHWEDDNGVVTLRLYYKKRLTGLGVLDKMLKMLLYFWGSWRGYILLQNKLGKPSLLHAHVLLRTGIAAYFLSTIQSTPYLITEHRSDYLAKAGTYAGRNALYKLLTRFICKKAIGITAVSYYLQQAMESHNLQNKYSILPNVADTSHFTPCPALRPKDKIRIIHISTMADHVKNISGMLRAFKRLSNTRSDFEAYMIGEWDSNEHVLHYADELGVLNKHVYFTGIKLGKDLTVLLQSGHFYVHFSNYETFGLALVEAMACGLPVISTDTGCATALITPATGKVLPVGDEKALYTALVEMCQHYTLYNTQAVLQQAEQFSYEKVGLQLYDIYNSGLHSNTSAQQKPASASIHL